jgi:predicted TIM-barrel fold metal-dependent hydrolase
MTVPVEYQTLEEVEGRLEDMDRYGIHKQIIFPTLFLIAVAEDVRLEAAFYRAYNNYVGRASAGSGGRLKWAALIPFRDPELARKELRRASELGASAVLTLGMIRDRCLNDPAFFPIFAGAADLDLPICVHFGWGSPVLTNLFTGGSTSFCSATTPVLWAFYHILLSGILSRVPKLRVGFLESGAGWVPYLIDQVRRRLKPQTVLFKSRPGERNNEVDPIKYFEEGRLFVACESEEDLPYLVSKLGEDSLMLASDYPHGDPSADEEFVRRVMSLEGLSMSVKEKLLGRNAERFFRS